jgi:hypothetical protein
MQNRRMFLGSAAAGVAAAAGGALLFPSTPTHAQGHAHSHDPLLIELHAQLAGRVRAITTGQGRPGEHVRSIATLLRLAKAHAVASRADAALRQQIRVEGRQALLLREPDLEAFRAHVKSLGLDPAPALRSQSADRSRLLDTILQRGVSGSLDAMSQSFDRLGVALDRSNVVAVNLRQPLCDSWWNLLMEIETSYWITCYTVVDETMCQMFASLWVVCYWAICNLGCGC